jgi:hypothetical protein
MAKIDALDEGTSQQHHQQQTLTGLSAGDAQH